jgi:hypothetical protein
MDMKNSSLAGVKSEIKPVGMQKTQISRIKRNIFEKNTERYAAARSVSSVYKKLILASDFATAIRTHLRLSMVFFEVQISLNANGANWRMKRIRPQKIREIRSFAAFAFQPLGLVEPA